MKAAVYVFLIFILQISVSLKNYGQVIPSGRRVDWKPAGLQQSLPVYTHIANITSYGGVGNGIAINDIAVSAAITSLGTDSGVIYFPAGVYLFHSPITLRSKIILKGQGATLTTLLFNLSGVNNLITITGSGPGIADKIMATATKNNFSAVVNNGSLFSAGDYVKIYQNDSALVLDIYNAVGQILRIKNIAGNVVTFYSPLRRSYNISDSPMLQKLSMITGTGVECLKIKRLDSTTIQTMPNIDISFAARCWVKGVESDSCNFAHVSVSSSTNVEVTGSYFHGAFGYGPGGQGYGVALNRTSGECLIENNIFRHLRHSMLVQSGSNGNVFTYNYSGEPHKTESTPYDLAGDIVLHGNYPYANLFEGNIVQNIVVDASHKTNGPLNTFFRNRAELYGILYSTASGDSSNAVGIEITGTGVNLGNYIMNGNGNFEYANNIKGVIYPPGTNSLPDNSYYYNSEPYFWQFATSWPTIGIPNPYNTRSIPAKARYEAGGTLTNCPTDSLLASHYLLLSATRNAANISLTWRTSNNGGARQYIVEQSTNGRSFVQLKTVAAGQYITTYHFIDNEPKTTVIYYRITEESATGSLSYSNIIIVTTGNTAKTLQIYPNPLRDRLNLYFSKDFKNPVITISNHTGQCVNNFVTNVLPGGVISLDVHGLATGVYFVKGCAENMCIVQKFIKE